MNILYQADQLYAQRAELSKVRESVELLRSDLRASRFEVQWRLSRAYFFLGQEAETPAEAKQHHRDGATTGRSAAFSELDRVEGHFWLGVNLALSAAAVPWWSAGFLALRARQVLLRAVAISPGYHGAGPHRVLARLMSRMPRLLGGGPTAARRHFESAVRIDPANTVTRIYYAEFLRSKGKFEESRKHLRVVIDAPPDDNWAFEQARDRAIARHWLAQAER
ncbi:MAG: TRAP transporter TatT component family protein [Pyrinomonadaceae bacterium]